MVEHLTPDLTVVEFKPHIGCGAYLKRRRRKRTRRRGRGRERGRGEKKPGWPCKTMWEQTRKEGMCVSV